MAWPLSQDYNEALQNPQSSFSDPDLRQGRVAVNAWGIPLPCSGNFADVYAVESTVHGGKWAVKCFTRQVHGLRERYSEISKHLQQARLPFTIDFQYLEQGIRIAGQWYPVLKMHWIEGKTLNAFVGEMLDKPDKLEVMSRIWLRMAQRLREAEIAHCDLQHGNVLLVPESDGSALSVRLIDYDGMWVPSLAQTPSGEIGHPAYQHPQRLRESTYRPEVDHFSLLTVYGALRALMVGGRALWERYDTGDNLLFRQQDFESPTRSPLFAELLRMKEPQVHQATAALIDAARMPLEKVPHITDLICGKSSAISSRRDAATRRASAVAEPKESENEPIIQRNTSDKRSNKARRWMIGAAAAAVLAVLSIGLLLTLRKSQPPEVTLTQRPMQAQTIVRNRRKKQRRSTPRRWWRKPRSPRRRKR